ncbi:FUSC family protein, partial [Actinospica durhamensis]
PEPPAPSAGLFAAMRCAGDGSNIRKLFSHDRERGVDIVNDRRRALGLVPLARLRRRDPGLAATRRAGRAAIVASALFALGMQVLDDSVLAYYAAFGCFSMLLFVDFTGPMAQRLRAQFALAVAWAALVCLGTVAARVTWVSVVATVAVVFVILFSGVVSSVLASASTALLLAFVIPVSSSVPYAQLPHRMAGVALAAGASMLAVWLLWPRPSADPLSAPAARACRAAAAQLRAEVAPPDRAPNGSGLEAIMHEAVAAAKDLRRVFDHAPYRPTGLSASSRALVRLVDELTWLSVVLAEGPAARDSEPNAGSRSGELRHAVAVLLDLAADLLDDPRGPVEPLRTQIHAVRGAMDALVGLSAADLPSGLRDAAGPGAQSYLATLDDSFRAKRLGFTSLDVGRNVELVTVAEQRGWFDQLLGRDPDTLGGSATSARDRAQAHLDPSSVWLHNSLRGAFGLGVAVALADVTSFQHSFWILLGTLSVLRSNAVNTGQNALRAVAGTVIGSVIGAGLLAAIGQQVEVLWAVLPLAIFVTGIAPAAISFAAGQAAFTITLVVLFSIGESPNVHLTLVRVQDVALGCAVSVVVAAFFWPRGAAAALGGALAEAYADSSAYLAGAVAYGLGRRSGEQALPIPQERRAAATARRLDDAYRGYLAEHGAKPVTLASMTTLVSGVVRLRSEADAVVALWRRAGEARLELAGADARRELLTAADAVTGWYRGLAEGIERNAAVPGPIGNDPAAALRLAESVQRDLHDDAGEATANAVRMIWTGDYIESARLAQPNLAAAVATFPHH